MSEVRSSASRKATTSARAAMVQWDVAAVGGAWYRPANISFWSESTRTRMPGGRRFAIAGFTTSMTTWLLVPSEIGWGRKLLSATDRAIVRNAWGRSITTLPSVISGATEF